MTRTWIRLTLAIAASAAGCDFSRWERGYPVSERRLTNIAPFDPAAVSVSAATTKPVVTTLPTTLPADQIVLPAPLETTLTLDECRRLALENNLDLKAELFNPSIAREAIGEERARFETLFTASTSFGKTDQATASELNSAQSEDLSANLGLAIPLRTGGTLRFQLPMFRTETDNAFSTLNPAYTSDAAASLSIPLLRGAGLAVNSRGIRIATFQWQSASAATKLRVTAVLADVDRIYWRLYAARRVLEVRKKEYDLAVAQLERARRQVRAQLAAEVEIVRAESGVADRIESIIIAQMAVRDRERELKQVVNQPQMPIESPTAVIPVSEPSILHYQFDTPALLKAAMSDRMEMLEADIRIATAADDVEFARNQLLPLLTLDYTYNVNGLGDSLPDAFQTLRSKRFEDHRVGVNLEVPIGNEAARARFRRALATRLQAVATKGQRAILVQNDVLRAVDQIETNWQRIMAAQRRVILAARVVNLEARRFGQGLTTSNDVLDAQTRLANAQSAEIAAITEYQIAQVDLAFATGTLLGSAGVTWAPSPPSSVRP